MQQLAQRDCLDLLSWWAPSDGYWIATSLWVMRPITTDTLESSNNNYGNTCMFKLCRSFSLNPIGWSYPSLGKMHCIQLIYLKCLVCYCREVETSTYKGRGGRGDSTPTHPPLITHTHTVHRCLKSTHSHFLHSLLPPTHSRYHGNQ